MALTKRQKEFLEFLAGFLEKKGYSPSYEEIAEGLDLASLATVHKHILALESLLAQPCGARRSRIALDKGERDGRVDLAEHGARARPEALEERPQLVGQCDALRYQVIAGAHQSAKCLDGTQDDARHKIEVALT